MNDVLAFCRREQPWLLETIETLVGLESPSTDKAAVDRCGAELERRLAAIGGRVQRLPRDTAGDHLLAEFGCGTTQVLVLGHFDTVWPSGQIARMPVTIEGGRLRGPGVFDMKAGIGIGMLAVRSLLETELRSPHRIVMLWTTDEEIGSASSRQAIEEEATRSAAVLVLEPALPGGAVKTSRKGCGEFRLDVRGIAAHAGVDPGRGASAIHELARQIVEIEKLHDLPRGISVNVGRISGGGRVNVVAEEAAADVDARAPTKEAAERIVAAMKGLRPTISGTQLTISGGFGRPPLERSAQVVELYTLARSIAADMGHELAEGGTGGGSDGNFTAALGVPTLDGLGAVGDGAHAIDEHVDVDALAWRAALVAGLIARLGAR